MKQIVRIALLLTMFLAVGSTGCTEIGGDHCDRIRVNNCEITISFP